MHIVQCYSLYFAGIIDSSGLKLIYTPTLRDIDVGMLEAGLTQGIIVPPGQSDFQVSGYCHKDVTKQVCLYE